MVESAVDNLNGNVVGGAIRKNVGKLPLQEVSPYMTIWAAEVLLKNKEKYPDTHGIPNWLHGLGFQGLIGSLERHLSDFKIGDDLDKDSKLHTLAHMACNLNFLIHFVATGRTELDDRLYKRDNK